MKCTLSCGDGLSEQVFVEVAGAAFRVASIPFVADLYLDDLIACGVDASGELHYRGLLSRGGHGKVLVKAAKATLQQILQSFGSIAILVDVDYSRGLCAVDLPHGRPTEKLTEWLTLEETNATLQFAVFTPEPEAARP